MEDKNQESTCYYHEIYDVHLTSPLSTNCSLPFKSIKGIVSQHLPVGVWFDISPLNYNGKNHSCLPFLMVRNDGSVLNVFVISNFRHYKINPLENSIKSQILLAIEKPDSVDICEYGFPNELLNQFAYGIKIPHGYLEHLLQKVIRYNLCIESLVELYNDFPDIFTRIGININPSTPVTNTVSELIIPSTSIGNFYIHIKHGKIVECYSLSEKSV